MRKIVIIFLLGVSLFQSDQYSYIRKQDTDDKNRDDIEICPYQKDSNANQDISLYIDCPPGCWPG